MSKKLRLLAATLFLSAILVTNLPKILSTASDSLSKTNSNTEPVVIGYSNWTGWWPWAIAEQEGLFAKHKLQVEFRWYDNYSQSLKDLATGSIDGNCQTLNDTISFAENAVNGEVAIMVTDNSIGNHKVIAAEGINEVKDLKNKKIGIEAGVANDFLLNLMLEKEKIARQDLKIINVETGAASAAFATGQVDAVGAFPPFWLTALKREGSKELISSKEFPGAISDLLVVTQKLIEEQPDKAQALVNTWFDVINFMKINPEKADQIMARRAGVTVEELQLFKEGTKLFTIEENLEAFKDGKSIKYLPYAAAKITDFLHNNSKSLKTKPNLRKIFNSTFLINASVYR
ncbi:MAG: ABC transporter substrate-binding protein [Waterburya sp.]